MLLAATAPTARGQMVPLWEGGLGVAALYMPDYRGSKHYQSYVLPIPYLVYRGEKLRLDRQGLRGVLFDSDRIYFDVSVAGSAPVNSRDNKRRAGMDDLDPALQLGPSLKINVYGREETRKFITLALPVRKVVTTNFARYEGQGYVSNPLINFNYGAFQPLDWNLGLSWGPLFADQQYHDYFYSVSAADATPQRPEYHARSGYSGSRLTFTLSSTLGSYWLATFAIYDNLHGAVIDDSPLVDSKQSYFLGFSAAWLFGKSTELVPERD